jgi:ankyrin repeat protein
MKTPVTDGVVSLTKAYFSSFLHAALSPLSRPIEMLNPLVVGNGTTADTVHDLAQPGAPTWLTLPPELRCMIRALLDAPSQLALAATCRIERDYYTAEQITELLVQKKVLALMAAPLPTRPLHDEFHLSAKDDSSLKSKRAHTLERFYSIILSRLLDPTISEQACRELAALAEKFFAHLAGDQIKRQLNYVLSTKPADYPWQTIFEKLARVNLHLCVTLVTKVSPGFDPATEDWTRAQVRNAPCIDYPFTELYPLLAQKLQFDQTGIGQLGGILPTTPDNIELANPRATQFFRQIRQIGYYNNTALYYALSQGYLDVVPALVQDHHCIDLVIDRWRGSTALLLLAEDMSKIKVRALAISDRDKINYTQAIHLLLQLNANPNLQNNSGNTALTYITAGECVDLKLVTALLQAGAQVNAKNEKGKTALMCAVENFHVTVVRELLAWGANPNLQEKFYGYTALMYAVKNNCIVIVRLLVNWGVDLSLQDNAGNTALMHALANRYFEVAALLQEKAKATLHD